MFKGSQAPLIVTSPSGTMVQSCRENSSTNSIICIRSARKQKLKVHIGGIDVEISTSYNLVNGEKMAIRSMTKPGLH